MLRPIILAALIAVLGAGIIPRSAHAQTSAFEKKNYSYSEWTKGRFSEAVTVTGPGKTIYLAGIGAEDENGAAGTILQYH